VGCTHGVFIVDCGLTRPMAGAGLSWNQVRESKIFSAEIDYVIETGDIFASSNMLRTSLIKTV